MLAFKISVLVIEKIGKVASTDDSGSLDFRAWVKNLNFTPPPPCAITLQALCVCVIVRGFCVTASSVYLLKFKIIATCLFFGIILLNMYFCNKNAFIQITFFLILSFFSCTILLWTFFYLCIHHYIARSAFYSALISRSISLHELF